MATKHIIGPGVGFSPGSVKYIISRGLFPVKVLTNPSTQATVTVPVHTQATVSVAVQTQASVSVPVNTQATVTVEVV